MGSPEVTARVDQSRSCITASMKASVTLTLLLAFWNWTLW
jgi:hypothetical protein